MQLQKMFGLAALFAAVAVSGCGGSGSSDALPPPPPPPPPARFEPVQGTKIVTYTAGDTTKTAQGAALGAYKYAQNGDGLVTDPKTSILASAPYSGIFAVDSAYSAGVGSFAGVAGTVGIAPADKNWTGKTILSIQLASTGASQKLRIKLGTASAAAAGNGCLPTTVVDVKPEMATYNIDLKASNFPMAECKHAPDPAIEPVFDLAILNLAVMEIEDNSHLDGKIIGIRVGEVGLK
jgi:hypothetical protein